MRALMDAATRLALTLDHPAYDCVYLALAEVETCPFVTADEWLLNKVARHPSGLFAGRVLSLTEATASITTS